MTVQTIKRMLDACYQAKRIREMLPALPSGVTPSYIHFLDVIQILERQGVAVKISDISDYLNIPRPGVTRTVKEMEKKGYLRKLFLSTHRNRWQSWTDSRCIRHRSNLLPNRALL